jgi:hypothetical protein
VTSLALVAFAACGDDDTTEEDVRGNITQASDALTEASEALDEQATEASGDLDEAASDVSDAITEGSEKIDDAAAQAAEFVARNIAALQGAAEFDDAGYPLDGGLDCTATVSDDVDAVDIACTGTTEDGDAAELTGTTNEIPGESVIELDGSFTGTVDGTEVFTTETLG